MDILNGDFGIFPTGSFSIPAAGVSFTYDRTISGVDVAMFDGPLPEQLQVQVS